MAAGNKTPENIEFQDDAYKKMCDHLKKMDFGKKKLLIITQIIVSGETFKKVGDVLKDIGINNFDFASLYAYDTKGNTTNDEKQNDKQEKFKDLFGSKLFLGKNTSASTPEFIETGHEQLSGIKTKSNYSLTPIRAQKQPESNEVIKKSREDVKLMAEKIIKKVWEEGWPPSKAWEVSITSSDDF